MTTQTEEIVIPQTEAGTGDYYQFEPDMYEAVVSDIASVPNPFEEDKTQLEFTFEVPGYQNEDGTVATKRAWCNPVYNAKSKLMAWSTVILGRTPDAGVPFRTSSLIGQPCRLVMNTYVKQDGTSAVKITDIMASKAAPAKSNGKAAKPGLVSRLKADPPAGVTVAEDDGIGACVLCGEPGTRFTGKGKPICADCA